MSNPPSPNPGRDAWTPFTPAGWSVLDGIEDEGRYYRLAVAAPSGPPPPEGYASLFVLDGAQHFAVAAGAAAALSRRPEKTGVGPVAVFGVFPQGGADGWDPDARFRDFTDAAPPPGEVEGRPFGGGAAFRRTLEQRLLAAAAHHLPLNPARRALFGHSLGGLFVLETRRLRPDLFARWIAISPSLWWRPDLPPAPGADLMIGCGEHETGRDMRRRIEAWGADDVRIATDADHGSAPFLLLPALLRFAAA